MNLRINGDLKSVDVSADVPLLWVLRDVLGLTGTKFGCGIAQCGACTVHVDGNPVRSCVLAVSSIGERAITTIEGVGATATGVSTSAVPGQTVSSLDKPCIFIECAQAHDCTPEVRRFAASSKNPTAVNGTPNMSAFSVQKHPLSAIDVQIRARYLYSSLRKPMNSVRRRSSRNYFGHQLQKDWTRTTDVDSRHSRDDANDRERWEQRPVPSVSRTGLIASLFT